MLTRPGGSHLAGDAERGEKESSAARNATDETQPGVGVPAPLHAAELLHVVNYVANSALKNQFYLQKRPQKKKRGKSVGASLRYLL